MLSDDSFGPCSMGPYPPLWGTSLKTSVIATEVFSCRRTRSEAFGPLDMSHAFISARVRAATGLSHRRRCDILHCDFAHRVPDATLTPVYRHHACITAYGIIGEHRPADQLYKENIIHMADTASTNANAWLPAFKAAFPLTIPICLGFLFLGASYGILIRHQRLLLRMADVHERVHLRRFNGIRHGESAALRVQPTRRLSAGLMVQRPSPVLWTIHAQQIQRARLEASVPDFRYVRQDLCHQLHHENPPPVPIDRGWFCLPGSRCAISCIG